MQLTVILKADGSGLTGTLRVTEAQLQQLQGQLAATGAQAQRTAGQVAQVATVSRQTHGSIRALASEFNSLRGTMATLGIAFVAREIVQAGLQMERFNTVLSAVFGSQRAAAAEMAYLRSEAERLGLYLPTLAQSYGSLAAATRGTNLEGAQTRAIFTAVIEAGRVMKLSNDEIAGTLNALQQIAGKGTVSMEELRQQLGDRLPGAMQIAARSMNMTVSELVKLVSEGKLASDVFLPRFADELRKSTAAGVELASNSPAAEFERIKAALFELAAVIAQGGVLDFLVAVSRTGRDAATVLTETVRVLNDVRGMAKDVAAAVDGTDGVLGDAIDHFARFKDAGLPLTATLREVAAALRYLRGEAEGAEPAVESLFGQVRAAPAEAAAWITRLREMADGQFKVSDSALKLADGYSQQLAGLQMTGPEMVRHTARLAAMKEENEVSRQAILQNAEALAREMEAQEAAAEAKRNATKDVGVLSGAYDDCAVALELLNTEFETNTKAAEDAAKAYQQAQDDVRALIDDLEFERKLLSLSNDEREVEIALRQAGAAATANQRAEIRALIEENQRLGRINGARDRVFGGISGIFEGAASEVANGASVWEGFRRAGVDAIGDIAQGFSDLVRETGSFGKAIDKLTADGGAVSELVGQISVAVGSMAGGGGVGAQLGATIGSAAATGIAAIASTLGWAAGPIGAIVGGLLGGLFDGGKDPTRIYVGSGVSRPEQSGSTSLGGLQVRTSGDQQPYSLDVLNAVTEFDRALASFLSEDQLAAVQARLARWTGVGETLEEVLIDRLDVVLEEMGPRIAGFVQDFSTDLETRVQALGDILALQRLAGDADLVTESLDSALTLITEFGRAGERVAETYQRIAQAAMAMDTALVLMGQTLDGTREDIVRQAAELAEAAGSPQRAQALWDAFFEEFYTASERAQARVTQARSAADSEFADIGLNVADYLGPGGRERFRQEFEAIFASLSAAQRLQYLEAAAALGLLTDAQAAYNDTLAEQGQVVGELVELNQQALESYAQIAEGIRNALADIGARSDFQRQMSEIARGLRSNIDSLQRAAREAGLQAAAERDLANAHSLAAAQAAQALAALMEAGREQAAELYGSRLSDIDAEIARIGAEARNPLQSFGNAMTEVANAANAATNLLLGDLSPLRDIDKLPLALEALQRGEISAEEVLRIAQSVKGSGADYNAIFAQVQAIVSRAGTGNVGGGVGGGDAGVDPRITALQREREQLLQQEAGLARFGQARDLAQTVADIAGATGESIEDVFRSLVGDRATLADFARDLRLDSVGALDAYIESLQAEIYDVADLAVQLRTVFNEHLTGLRQIFNDANYPGAIALDVEPGTNGKPIPVAPVLPGINVESTTGNTPAAQLQTSVDLLLEATRTMSAYLQVLVESVPESTAATAEAARDTVERVEALAASLSRDAGPAQQPPRSARTGGSGGRDQYGRPR